MLNALKKGDRVVTGGGLIGTVEKIVEGEDEIVINLGDMKVTALRSTIHQKDDPRLSAKPSKDVKAADKADKDVKTDKVDSTAKAKDPAKPAKKTASAKAPASKTAKKK